jgi:hypothetical protein
MNATRQLAYHLLDLPFHEQVKVSHVFGFDVTLPSISHLRSEEICKEIIKEAVKVKKLELLWSEVESRHRDGKVTPNPFQKL